MRSTIGSKKMRVTVIVMRDNGGTVRNLRNRRTPVIIYRKDHITIGRLRSPIVSGLRRANGLYNRNPGPIDNKVLAAAAIRGGVGAT